MVSNSSQISVKLLTLAFTLLLLYLPNSVNSVPVGEIDSMLSVLGGRGYTLFCNAISVSDILYDVLEGSNFTFFAPTDSSLFALDMTNTASDYTSALRYHVVPKRFSLDELRTIPPGFRVPTMVPNREVLVERRSAEDDIISIDGVVVVVPGLFYGRNVAVHGLGGILSLRSHVGMRNLSPPVTNIPEPPTENISGYSISEPPAGDHTFSPAPAEEFNSSRSFSFPPAENFNGGIAPADSTGTAGFSPGLDLWPYISWTEPPAPEISEADENPVAPSPYGGDTYEESREKSEEIRIGITSLFGLADDYKGDGEAKGRSGISQEHKEKSGISETTPFCEATCECFVSAVDETAVDCYLTNRGTAGCLRSGIHQGMRAVC